jgi:hypothetical protein
MQLTPTNLERVAIMQQSPLRYFERRIEHAALMDDRHYAMTVTQQFTVPLSHGQDINLSTDQPVVVPLGWFAKDRLPNIEVLAEDGSILPFLKRRDQGKVGAVLFAAEWRRNFFFDLPGDAEDEAQLQWALIRECVEQVLTSTRKAAQVVVYSLRQHLREQSLDKEAPRAIRCFLLAILAEDEFWRALKTLAEVRLLFTRMSCKPNRPYVVTIKYVERFDDRLPPPRAIRDRARWYRRRNRTVTARRITRGALGWFGVSNIGLTRKAINLGQAASFWIIFSTPEGVEPIRCFWRKTRGNVLHEDIVSIDSTKAALGKHHTNGQSVAPDVLMLDVQIAPSSAILSAAVLAALLFLVGFFVYKAMPQLACEHNYQLPCVKGKLELKKHLQGASEEYLTSLLGIGTILSATPAAIAGALAYRGHTFVRRASRGPRIMLALLSAEAALLAVVMGVHGPGEFARDLAYALSVSALPVAGIFTYIRFGWRWRRNERSRRPLKTKAKSPDDCRRKQVLYASRFLLPWLLLATLVALAQVVL